MEYLDIHCPSEGKISLSIAAVRQACGDPRDFPRIEWQHHDYRHGHALPLGMINGTPPKMTDSEALRMTRDEMDAYLAACQPVEGHLPAFQPFAKRGRKAKVAEIAPEKPVERVSDVSAPVAPPEAPVALPAASVAPVAVNYDLAARVAHLEALLGVVARPKRTAAHEATIRRAWAMRAQMRVIEAARFAAVHRAQCDMNAAIDAEDKARIAIEERDEALALAVREETARIAADRAAGKARAQLAAGAERADRLARIAVSHRRDVRHARQDVSRAVLEVAVAKASERQALRKLSDLRSAVDGFPMAAKAIEKRMAA